MRNLFKAIYNVQQEVGVIKQIRKNEFGGFKYTDLTDVVLTIKPSLAKNNLGFISQMDENNVIKTTLFEIESGETIETTFKIDTDVQLKGMNKYQVIGSAISYIKKYQLVSLLGLVSDEKSIDELKNEREPQKKGLTDERFIKALENIQAGTYTVEKLTATFALTEAQLQTLKDNGIC
jgi:hypothetical protein